MEKAPAPVHQPSILENVEKQLQLARKLENVYSQRPEISTFIGAMSDTKFAADYTKEAIDSDLEYVKRTRVAIDETNSGNGRAELDRLEGGFQLSEIMQAMVVDRMNNHWFKGVQSIMTSDYDDLRVGIDAVMKHEKGTYLGAAFDFTVTNQDKKVYEKLEKEWVRNVKDGKVPTVKYFEDPDTKEKKKLLVPKFIIGASKKDVEELAEAYLNDDAEKLEKHPFKYVMLMQIEEQLQTVLDYYETVQNPAFDFAKTQYQRIQTLLRGMKNDIHIDEAMHENVDLYEYSKGNIALDMMKRFRIMRSRSSAT